MDDGRNLTAGVADKVIFTDPLPVKRIPRFILSLSRDFPDVVNTYRDFLTTNQSRSGTNRLLFLNRSGTC